VATTVFISRVSSASAVLLVDDDKYERFIGCSDEMSGLRSVITVVVNDAVINATTIADTRRRILSLDARRIHYTII